MTALMDEMIINQLMYLANSYDIKCTKDNNVSVGQSKSGVIACQQNIDRSIRSTKSLDDYIMHDTLSAIDEYSERYKNIRLKS